MHAVCLNIGKHFMTYWFSEKYNTKKFSLFHRKTEIERHLKKLKFPHYKTRKPRNLEEFEDWKAVEFQ